MSEAAISMQNLDCNAEPHFTSWIIGEDALIRKSNFHSRIENNKAEHNLHHLGVQTTVNRIHILTRRSGGEIANAAHKHY